LEHIGAIDVVVNNAGYGMEAPVEESSLEEIRRQFEVNLSIEDLEHFSE
jgi:NAD(P)-dependent dehydrogenase (short-subunit alcohol dehydrogenase family)